MKHNLIYAYKIMIKVNGTGNLKPNGETSEK